MTQGIRENFAHYKNVTDEKTIREVCYSSFDIQINSIFLFFSQLIRAAKDTDSYLRREVLQTVQTGENTYRMFIIFFIYLSRIICLLGLVVKPYMLFDNTRLIRHCEDDEKDHHEKEEEEKLKQQGLSPCEIAARKLK